MNGKRVSCRLKIVLVQGCKRDLGLLKYQAKIFSDFGDRRKWKTFDLSRCQMIPARQAAVMVSAEGNVVG